MGRILDSKSYMHEEAMRIPLIIRYPGKIKPGRVHEDLVADPGEMINLYHEPGQKDLIDELKQKLLDLKVRYDDTDEKYPELMEQNKTHF